MASLRQLPSKRWQASVLLDDGSRSTKVHDTRDKALAWAQNVEDERDELRRRKGEASADEHAAVLIAALRDLAVRGLLKESHLNELADLSIGAHEHRTAAERR